MSSWWLTKKQRRKREMERERSERFERVRSVVEEFDSLSEATKKLLSWYDRSSSSGYYGNLIIEDVFYFRYYSYFSPYGSEHVYWWASEDYRKLRGSVGSVSELAEFSAEDLKNMFFDESRFRTVASEKGLSLGEITPGEWDLITRRYLSYVSAFISNEISFENGLLAAMNQNDRAFRRLAYVHQTLAELQSSGGIGSSVDDSEVDESRWLEEFERSADR